MDAKFHPAIAAVMSGDLEGLSALLVEDPSLATARSSRSHPTLLQCLALDAVDVPNKIELAKLLVDAGAEINEPLVAAASIGNVDIVGFLLDCGGAINGIGNGSGSWSPLEEALYWNGQEVIDLLLARGATVHNLRLAAGLGRVDVMKSFFGVAGELKPEAGRIAWPFGDQQNSNLSVHIKHELQAKVSSWTNAPGEIVNNAFVYACMHNHIEAAQFLLEKGAEVNAIPPGFDYSGTGLHYAALNGHKAMVDFLIEQGADVNIKDTKVGSTPAGWANHAGHVELKNYLDQVAQTQTQTEKQGGA